MTGRLQWHHRENGSSAMDAPYTAEWDLTSNSGSRLRPGIYIYRVAIRTAGTGDASQSGKFILLAQ